MLSDRGDGNTSGVNAGLHGMLPRTTDAVIECTGAGGRRRP